MTNHQIVLICLFYGLIIAGLLVAFIIGKSCHKIGEAEIGLVSKVFSLKGPSENPVALNGEAGYQAKLLMPGWRFKLWPFFQVRIHSWVQIPANQIGIVISQIGEPLPTGAKSAVYKKAFGNFENLSTFLGNGGQKGIQRPVLPPGSLLPIHPVAFLVLTKEGIYGVPISDDQMLTCDRPLSVEDFGLKADDLNVTRIETQKDKNGLIRDVCGIVTTFEGDPLPSGDIASRIGGYSDIAKMEQGNASSHELIEELIGTKNPVHNNYQDYQAFLDAGGKIGLQHDPLLYGAYILNPFLVKVEIVPMLVVQQGQVAVIKGYVGLPTEDTSGEGFKHGSLVKPGHRGIWEEPLRTGKYAINPRCYEPELVRTSILTLNWADAVSSAHSLDRCLSQITAKSNEGFIFQIDLQVQIHVPDTKAAQVISMVGTMPNLVNEVLQAAVGNHFRDKLQSMPAIDFIKKRQEIQKEAFDHISKNLLNYKVETKGVYIQDVIFPKELVDVLTEREIATQRIETYQQEQKAEENRIQMEAAKGRADQQAALARSEIGIRIKSNDSDARKAEAEREAAYITQTGEAAGAKVRSVGLAQAEAYRKQVEALGQGSTALINIAQALKDFPHRISPEVLVASGGSFDGLAGTLMKYLGGKDETLGDEKKTKVEKSRYAGIRELRQEDRPKSH